MTTPRGRAAPRIRCDLGANPCREKGAAVIPAPTPVIPPLTHVIPAKAGISLPRAHVRGRARVFVRFCCILSDTVAFCRILLTASLASYLGARCDWEWMTGDGLGRGVTRSAGCISRILGLSPRSMVLRSGHKSRIVRKFCSVKCESVGSMCLRRYAYGCASEAMGWIPAFAGMTW